MLHPLTREIRKIIDKTLILKKSSDQTLPAPGAVPVPILEANQAPEASQPQEEVIKDATMTVVQTGTHPSPEADLNLEIKMPDLSLLPDLKLLASDVEEITLQTPVGPRIRHVTIVTELAIFPQPAHNPRKLRLRTK